MALVARLAERSTLAADRMHDNPFDSPERPHLPVEYVCLASSGAVIGHAGAMSNRPEGPEAHSPVCHHLHIPTTGPRGWSGLGMRLLFHHIK
jgi:hypothetical protein